ncbi:5262_t:CDS:1, partial [Acaulospora morrowiae]
NPSDQPVFATALLRTGEAKDALVEVQKRHNDIRQIEQTISELADLFKELSLQVEIQDQIVTDIESQVQDTRVKIEQSNNQLGEATRLAYNARRKKWYCL